MSGYHIQSQNQSFAVTLDPSNSLWSEISFLKSTMLAPTSTTVYEFFTGPFSGFTTIPTGLTPQNLLGGFVTFTGLQIGVGYILSPGLALPNGTLPYASELFAAWKNKNLALYGNQIYNVPSTQREFLTTPTPGDSVFFNLWNNTANKLKIDPNTDPNYVTTGAYLMSPFSNAIFQLTILDSEIPRIAFSCIFNF